jgi:hypothetical protein
MSQYEKGLAPCKTQFELWEKDEKRQIGDESHQTVTTSCGGDNVGATPCLSSKSDWKDTTCGIKEVREEESRL